MHKKIVAGNWKMNLNWAEAKALADRVMEQMPGRSDVLLAAPAVYLQALASKAKDKPGLSIAAQDCSAHEKGAFTGEVSAFMLAAVGASHCLVGHSERHQYHGETDALVAEKIRR